jgi:hypothetical protein
MGHTLKVLMYIGIQDFKSGGGTVLKKLRRVEGGAEIFGLFLVKNHDFTPKNHIFSNFPPGSAPGILKFLFMSQ